MGMYISHDETEESSGLWDDDPKPRGRVVIANKMTVPTVRKTKLMLTTTGKS
jgi:hypothetical protein